MTSTFWHDGYRDAQAGNNYSPPEHSSTSVYTAEYQRGYNAYFDERARPVGETPHPDDVYAYINGELTNLGSRPKVFGG